MPPPHLPPEVCRKIFILLPAKTLVRFRAVCKAWLSVIDDPFFVKAHIDKQIPSKTIIIRASTGPPFSPLYSVDLDALNFTDGLQTISATPLDFTRSRLTNLRVLPVAACNGLMLIGYSEGITEIWNPLTHERLKLPQRDKRPNTHVVGIGLGFDCAAYDYKVVVIETQHNNDFYNPKSTSQIYVYSLKLDSWRTVGSCPVGFYDGKGVFLNGSLYWLSFGVVFVFDVVTENYRQLALPVIERRQRSNLHDLNGCLFLSCVCDDLYHTASFDVWVMNEDEGKDLWMKLFKFEKAKAHSQFHFSELMIVAFVKNKSLVLLQHNLGFLLFDFERNSTKNVSIHGFSKISAQTCVESLFRLHDSCGRVALKTRTRKGRWKGTMKTTETKLTFCVKDFHRYNSSHDYCSTLNSNSYNSSCESNEVCGATLNPEVDTPALSITLDICREIFLNLPAQTLLRFRAISKAHCAVIDDQFFVKSHTNRQLASNNTVIIRNSTGPPFNPFYSFNLDDLDFTDILQTIVVTPLDFPHSELSFIPSLPTATCNGLILVACKKNWEIWNPSTDERLELPRGNFHFNPKAMDIGLGYDFSTNDYKAVVIDRRQRRREKEVYRINVYSLKLDSWSEMIMNFPFPCGPGVFVCGSLNWLSTPGTEKQVIIALDLGTENYRQLQLPPLPETRRTCYGPKLCLDVLDGCLILNYFSSYSIEYNYLDVWVMKVYGDEDSWVQLFSNEKIRNVDDPESNLRVVAYLKNKNQFLLQDGSRGIFLFDVESNSVKKVGIHGLTGNLSAQRIPGSIFRLHDNCGVGGIRKTRIIKRESRMFSDTELNFCVRDDLPRDSHDNCYSLDSNCCYSSGEDEDS